MSPSSSSSSSSSKETESTTKTKDAVDAAVWENVRHHIESCPPPGVSRDHPAIQAALQGIDRELQKRQRDAKLHKKFSTTTSSSNPHPPETNEFESVLHPKKQQRQQEQQQDTANRMEDEDNDWQTISAATSVPPVAALIQQENSPLGLELAQTVVRLLSDHSVQMTSPAAALAVVFHAAILATRDWECTGIPESTPQQGGFAPPIRPISTFLPLNWNSFERQRPPPLPSCPIQLRYHPKKTLSSVPNSVIVTVKQQQPNNNNTLSVVWHAPHTAAAKEPNREFVVSVPDHLNLESWNKATHQSTAPASPCLHYKALASLLTQWIHHPAATQTEPNPFFLLANSTTQNESTVLSDASTTSTLYYYRDAAVEALPSRHYPATVVPATTPETSSLSTQQQGRGFPVPTTVQQAFPGLVLPQSSRGQFSGDLLPGGGAVFPSRGHFGDDNDMGNLMGPNHSAFRNPNFHNDNCDNNNNSMGGGFLRPRFDPLGPPPTHPDFDGTNGGGTPDMRNNLAGGIPNRDHLRPPNNLNNNMFL